MRLSIRASSAAAQVLDCLFPRNCILCAAHLDAGTVCDECRADLPWIERACPTCALPTDLADRAATPCADCQRRPLPVTGVVAPLAYRFPVDELVKALKFRRQAHLAPAFADLLVPALTGAGLAPTALVPVPLHRWRHGVRGFNQAAEIARGLSRHLDLPVRHMARRVRSTRPQPGLGAEARRCNVRDAFRVVRRPGCRHALIVDDVITTGETCRALATALLNAGVEEVSLVALARATHDP